MPICNNIETSLKEAMKKTIIEDGNKSFRKLVSTK